MNLLFFDPDNGIKVTSRLKGRENSCKTSNRVKRNKFVESLARSSAVEWVGPVTADKRVVAIVSGEHIGQPQVTLAAGIENRAAIDDILAAQP